MKAFSALGRTRHRAIELFELGATFYKEDCIDE
jgi:hypothetical protein